MTNELLVQSPNALFVTESEDKSIRQRLKAYVAWLDLTKRHWSQADLRAYKNYLFSEGRQLRDEQNNWKPAPPLSASSALNYLGSVRERYRELLVSNEIRDWLYALTPPDASPADRKALVDEALVRINNNINPYHARVRVVTKQDEADDDHVRLTQEQAHALLDAAERGGETRAGLRNAAIIALLLCTGIREQELCNLDVIDLRQRLHGQLALRVREGKGAVQRLVPYGELDWGLAHVDAWLEAAGIGEYGAAVFRGLYKGGQPRPTRMNAITVQRVIADCSAAAFGDALRVTPHDLRRTYARQLYDQGVPVTAIQANLGHKDVKTTYLYIGRASADERAPKNVYER